MTHRIPTCSSPGTSRHSHIESPVPQHRRTWLLLKAASVFIGFCLLLQKAAAIPLKDVGSVPALILGTEGNDLAFGGVVLSWLAVSENYKAYIIAGTSLVLVEVLLLLGLMWQRKRRRRAEAELSIAYDRLRMAVEAGTGAAWEWDVPSGICTWFGDLKTMFGINSDRHQENIEDLRRRIHPNDLKAAWRAIVEARRTKQPFRAEFRILWPDGSMRWIVARGKFYPIADKAERMVGMALDITQRKQQDEALRKSEERFRLAAQAGKMFAYEWDAATDLIVRSAESAQILGIDHTNPITGQEVLSRVHQDDQEGLLRAMADLHPEKPYLQTTYRMIRPDGQVIWVERNSRAQFDEHGRILRIIGMVTDVTARKQMEEQLQESEARFRSVANTAPVLIWMAGPDKLCDYFNQPWLEFTGRRLEQELGYGWVANVHPEDLAACLEAYTRSFDTRERLEIQYRLRRHDGEYRWVHDIGVPRFSADRTFEGYIGSCMDVTERKLAEETLSSLSRRLIDAQEQERTRVARELHDDISQQIALLAMELDHPKHFSDRSVEFQSYIDDLRRRVLEIGAQVQAISHRLHSSKLEYLGLVAATKSFCKELVEQHCVKIDFTSDGVPPSLRQDISICLFRILQEALTNAVKHSGVKDFQVKLLGTGNEIQLTVRDSGVAFDVEAAMKKQGIGLISMQERVSLARGTISIVSEPTRGTEVNVRVPLCEITDSSRARAGAA